MSARAFSPGFRCSVWDGVVLAVGVVGCAVLATVDVRLAFLVGFTVGHFFLFCNVFRMPRWLELIWSGVFVALCAATFQLGRPHWWETAAISSVVTVVVIGIAMRQPSYHGIGWQVLNPQLPTWWERKPAAEN